MSVPETFYLKDRHRFLVRDTDGVPVITPRELWRVLVTQEGLAGNGKLLTPLQIKVNRKDRTWKAFRTFLFDKNVGSEESPDGSLLDRLH